MTKTEVRQKIMTRRPDFQTLEEMSSAIVHKLQSLELLQTAHAIGIYIPLPDEVNISLFFHDLASHRNLYIPAFDESLECYRMATYTPALKPGKFDIPEPVNPIWATADELDLIVVPGIAFDTQGNRLGRGGGFYDRLLPCYTAARIGICFDFQCLEKIETEPHDCKMNYLVTESKCLEFVPNS